MTSFREQAAIALFAVPRANHWNAGPHEPNRLYSHDAASAASEAQALADACCAAWGHELPFQGCDLVDDGDDDALAKERSTCERCGKRVTPVEPFEQLCARVLEALKQSPGATALELREMVRVKRNKLDAALASLKRRELVVDGKDQRLRRTWRAR